MITARSLSLFRQTLFNLADNFASIVNFPIDNHCDIVVSHYSRDLCNFMTHRREASHRIVMGVSFNIHSQVLRQSAQTPQAAFYPCISVGENNIKFSSYGWKLFVDFISQSKHFIPVFIAETGRVQITKRVPDVEPPSLKLVNFFKSLGVKDKAAHRRLLQSSVRLLLTVANALKSKQCNTRPYHRLIAIDPKLDAGKPASCQWFRAGVLSRTAKVRSANQGERKQHQRRRSPAQLLVRRHPVLALGRLGA